jgi:hypothetical protein
MPLRACRIRDFNPEHRQVGSGYDRYRRHRCDFWSKTNELANRLRDRSDMDTFAPFSIRMTAVLGAVPMAAALIALAFFGPETRHKRLEQITAEELAPQLAD